VRPQGWQQVKLKRVEEVERIERNKGVAEHEITFKRANRVAEVCQLKLDFFGCFY
jgi:hypothetical protein